MIRSLSDIPPVATNRAVLIRKAKEKLAKPAIRKVIEICGPQEAIERLNDRQKKFVEEYLVDFNGARAARAAGYVCKDPGNQARDNLKHPGIRLAIDTIKQQRAAISDVTSDYVLKKIAKIVEAADEANDRGNALRGLELLGRHLSMFTDKTELTGKDGEAIKYENNKQDADAFTSAINSLAARARKTGISSVPDTGATG